MRRLGTVIFVLLAAMAAQMQAQNYAVNGACTLGGQATVTQGVPSSGTRPLRGSASFPGTGVVASYPGCTVTVYQTGTVTPAQIFSTASGGALSNPFTANLIDGSWVFFAAGACYDIMISSGAIQSSTMPNSKTFPGVCAGGGGGGGGGSTTGTSVTVNGTAAVPNALNFSNVLLAPANGTVINFLLNGNNVGAYLLGNGSPTTCMLGTGWGLCPGGGGGSGTLPTTPLYDLFASTGAGAAEASGLLGHAGFLKGQVFLATGDVTSAPAPFSTPPNASVEYFPTGFGNFGKTNGLAAYFSHSGVSGAAGNGGIALGGGNSSGGNYQIYQDCEMATGCTFTVPIYENTTLVAGRRTPLRGRLQPTPRAGNPINIFNSPIQTQGFAQAYVVTAIGDATSAPTPFGNTPNASVEYFPQGATFGGSALGTTNGLAAYFSHSANSGASGNGGIALGGGNVSGTNYQVYLDCEVAGCDFKVPVTYLGTGIGGGGGGSGTVGSGTAGHFTWYATTGTAVTSNAHLDDGATTAGTITSTEPLAFNTATGTGISITSAGGTLPTLASGTGGIGIGLNGVPMMNLGTGAGWINIPTTGGGAGGVSSINGTVGAFTFTGAGVSCATTTCTFSGTGSGTTLPTIAVNNLYASNGSGGAQDTGVKATGGFIQSAASIVNGTAASSPFTGANASQEWYGAGGVVGPVTFANGAALFMGHSGVTGVGGIALGGGNNATTEQIYLDCEVAGCDFKVPVTQNGSPITGGGGGGASGAPNQTAPIQGTPPTATLTSTTQTGALVWACWDGNTPANAIYPSNVSLNPSTSTITFTFLAPQTGYCAINGTGSGPLYAHSESTAGVAPFLWQIPASTHNLGAVVNVRTYDSTGNEIFGNTSIAANGDVTVTWLTAQAGKVVISQ